VAGQFGQWAPIGVEQTANGYEVALKLAGADQYTVWNTDSSGNYLSSLFNGGSVSGSDATLESLETGFHQDLNGDGLIGPPPPVVIEAFGSTSLVQVGSNYFFYPNGGAAGPEFSYGGAAVVAGQFGQWTLIGAEQTASGYVVALKLAGVDQYTVWNTDSSGNYLSAPIGVVSGTSTALESYETSFHQDLNGDGLIGPPPPVVIEAFGSTSLVQVGSNYFLYPVGGSAGPELSDGGVPVAAGQFPQWAPIGAEQTASGYVVAWKETGADQYSVWNTDSIGNYLSGFGNVSGLSAALQSSETSLHQDVNGDGYIGLPPQTPTFVYQSTDSNGVQTYDVTWPTAGLQPFALRVLVPDHPSANYSHSFLYDLPVEPGLTQPTLGDGLNELQKLGVQNQYNTTIIEPIFPIYSWYADSATDPTINYDTFMSTFLPQWVSENFGTTGTEQNLLIGFSKGGYGGLDLLFKHPDVFTADAAFDFPADMATYDAFNASSSGDYGTDANFQNNYRLTSSFIDSHKAPFTTADRVLISEGSSFGNQVAHFDALLTAEGIPHTLLKQTQDAHSWTSGWLSSDVAGLFGLAHAIASLGSSSSAAVTSVSAPVGAETQQSMLAAPSNPLTAHV
jgi:hypothetical protein